MQKLWFRAKRYGWGWTPCSWEGWLVTLVAIVAMVGVSISVDQNSHSVSDTLLGATLPILVIAGLLITIAWLTGEKPRWRWGGK